MMAKQYYQSLNKNLAQKAERIDWRKEGSREVIIFRFKNPKQPMLSYSIRFDVRDYTKLYVMDNPEFLGRLWEYFIPKEMKEIDYHKHYAEGFNKYTNIQKEGIEALLELEKKIIERKHLRPAKNYIGFREIMEKAVYNEDEQDSLISVRNALLHYNLNFEKKHLKRFYAVMRREGIERRWSLTV